MSRFDRYVLSQLMVQFGFFSLVLVAIYWINKAIQVFDQLISDGQSAGTVLAFTALTIPFLMAIVMPMSAFAAAVNITNRLNSDSELVVVQATGYSPMRLSVPFAIFGGIVCAMILVLFNLLMPAASEERGRLQADLPSNVTAKFLTPGEFLHPTKGITFYIGALSPEGVLKSVFLTDAREEARKTTYMAREAFLISDPAGPRLVMVDGIAQTLLRPGDRLSVTRFDDFAFDIGRLIPAVRPARKSIRDLSTFDLLAADPDMVAEFDSTPTKFSWEAHNRIAQSFLGFVAPLVGFTTLLLGAFSRFGVWRQILAAIGILIVLKLVDNSMSSMSRSFEGAWPMQYLGVIAGIALCLAMMKYAGRTRRTPPLNGEAMP